MVAYLDVLDEHEVPIADRVLAALRPKALALAAERTAGTHPYLTTPDHTRTAREQIGAGVLLAPEQTAVIATDADREEARATARGWIGRYLGLRNYTNNLMRHGFTEADVDGSGSDALIDALVAHAYGLSEADLRVIFRDFTERAVPPAYRERVVEHYRAAT